MLSFTSVFIYDIITRVTEEGTAQGTDLVHDLHILIGFATIAAYFVLRQRRTEVNPVKTIGRVTIVSLGILIFFGIISASSLATFYFENGRFIPKNFSTLMIASMLSIGAGIAAIYLFTDISDLIYLRRKRHTKRNFILLLVVGAVTILHTIFSAEPSTESNENFFTPLLLTLCVITMIVNSFRLSWIVHLSRREKFYGILFLLFGMFFFIMLTIFSFEPSNLLHQALIHYQPGVQRFVSLVLLFASIYFGLSFASTLFQLPTAEAFDRKKVEISSLQNMSRLITQVFDYDELVATSINLTLDVAEANAAWLELFPHIPAVEEYQKTDGHTTVSYQQRKIVSSKDIERWNLPELKSTNGTALQEIVIDSLKPLLIHDFAGDRRVSHLKQHRKLIGSLALIPLISHNRIIGIIGIIKTIPYGFDRDILNAVLAFTDLVTIALENNRLIDQSIEKERLEQEMMVAQQMQQKLLPQQLPAVNEFELSAVSLPAYEVGGDYYDVVQLDGNRIGLIIGDVSGKGVSAALYMAQVKGIFQSLCQQASTTKDLLIRTNSALYGNIERRSFVSLLYAIIDIERGTLSYSRAGHCPILYLNGDSATFHRPNGMGLGLDNTSRFRTSIEEDLIQLHADDLLILYTDGITEAKNAHEEEFGTTRLADVVLRWRTESCTRIMQEIIKEVKSFTGGGAAEDDITLLVVRWRGTSGRTTIEPVEQMFESIEN